MMTADPPAAEVKCPRCSRPLGHTTGDRLLLGGAFFDAPAKLVCGGCLFVWRWKPGKVVDTGQTSGQNHQ